jgi:hypothetical protein
MIQDPQHLRAAIRDADAISYKLEQPVKFSAAERRHVAQLLRGLADIARRAFEPNARRDWSVVPREPTEDDDAPGLFPKGGA